MPPTLSTKPFFATSDLDLKDVRAMVQDGLVGADYGEFYHQIKTRESFAKDMGAFTDISVGSRAGGFGFRVGQEDRVGYSYSDQFNKSTLKLAIAESRSILTHGGQARAQVLGNFGRAPQTLYTSDNSMGGMSVQEKISAIDEIDAYIRGMDPHIRNVTVAYQAAMERVHIITADGRSLVDYRPRAALSIDLQLAGANGQSENGSALLAVRGNCRDLFNQSNWQMRAEEALHTAQELLRASDSPGGTMDVVLAPGWGGVLLHEAVGHGLEGDFNRKNVSVYSGKIGERVAAPGVTVIDQGDLVGERGSLHFDDEGTPTQRNVLIEDGILQGYMQDRQNAHLMKAKLTGNGRRQGFEDMPMPRMTNTYFANGDVDRQDIISSVKDGLYVAKMGGGQVDITNGKFNMNAKLAYRIRNGQLCEPIKGASMIGDGLGVIKNIRMIGNDLEMERDAGVCGKNGQGVIVGCGQPTICVEGMVVAGPK
ncbi:MAG: metalloprotease TldD [Alphaproteobacteria bacterium]|nr:metalloprotease TldD [Alphaproteobacteria bacterium]HCQ71629.1 metalloprotease TldD [Rhodospirillaceae bacterium]|tara:strand:+ start:18158 stop:19600 length:1443 start_codon:yes stop_codon:yes gene_type:complete